MQEISKEKNKRFVLLGDFNINLLQYDSSNSVKAFIDSLHSFFLLPSISLPTRTTETSSTLIDNIFFTPTKYKACSGNILVGISDHLPQFLILENYLRNENEKIYFRCWKNFDKEKFTVDFLNINWKETLSLEQKNLTSPLKISSTVSRP